MNENIARRTTALVATAALITSVMVGAIAPIAAAAGCTEHMKPGVPWDEIRGQGQVLCGTDGADAVAIVADGAVFKGGDGDDTVGVLWDATFKGGDGNDVVRDAYMNSYFKGGDGNDGVMSTWPLYGQLTFKGQSGDDWVYSFYAGSFDGGGGTDTVSYFYDWGPSSCAKVEQTDGCPKP
jgi:hypothetical protein